MRSNGKAKNGAQRYRCKDPGCGASQAKTTRRDDVARRYEFGWFITWLLTGVKPAQVSERTFYRRTAWCWNVTPPQPEPTGEIHRYLMLDGTYFNDYCALVAYNGTDVVGWQCCDREKTASWTALLQQLMPPDIAVVDGHGALESVIRALWPDTAIQRCYFHFHATIRKHLTRNPRTTAGQELLALTRTLGKISTAEQAAAFTAEFASWTSRWDGMLTARTYAHSGQRPSYVRAGQQWWYTHRELRKAHGFIKRLIIREQLFTWMTAATADEVLPKTTSPLEGGMNTGIKELLRRHRGMTPHHAMIAIGWYLNTKTERPQDPWSLVTPAHWAPRQHKARQHTTAESIGPALYDTSFSWDDGNGIQHGWGGRSQRP